MWGDILKDMAETYSDWHKINKCYEAAYDKFRLALSISGPFVLLLSIWSQILQRHALAADQYQEHDKAESLRRSAEHKMKGLHAINQMLTTQMNEAEERATAMTI